MNELTPEICSCSALRQAARHISRIYDDALAPVGLGVNQYSILSKLNRLGPQSIQDLAQILVMDRSTLGHLLRPLEKRKLVQIVPGKQDRRRRVIELTQAGTDLITASIPLWIKAEHWFAKSFGEENALDLRTILKKITLLEITPPPPVTGD
jgi:DNA-binding MarR family transcriptional regulator